MEWKFGWKFGLTFSFQLPPVSVIMRDLHESVKKSGASCIRHSANELPSLTVAGLKVTVPPNSRQLSS